MVLAGSLAVLGMLVVSKLVMGNVVVRPLRQLEDFAYGEAADVLDKTLDLGHTNEIGKLGDILHSMVLSLKDTRSQASVTTKEQASE